MGRIGRPEEVAAAVVFLAGPGRHLLYRTMSWCQWRRGDELTEYPMNTVFYAELPWPEVEARIAADAPVFLPLGATEQHGRHMALNVDVVLPTAIAARVAARVGGLVLPTVGYGNRSQPKTGGGPGFPGTLNLTAHTFSLILRDLICELYRQNVRKIVTVNGHYENIGPTIEGIELAP
ncbi:MAG: creatininase family protein [Cypionkella sp.]